MNADASRPQPESINPVAKDTCSNCCASSWKAVSLTTGIAVGILLPQWASCFMFFTPVGGLCHFTRPSVYFNQRPYYAISGNIQDVVLCSVHFPQQRHSLGNLLQMSWTRTPRPNWRYGRLSHSKQFLWKWVCSEIVLKMPLLNHHGPCIIHPKSLWSTRHMFSWQTAIQIYSTNFLMYCNIVVRLHQKNKGTGMKCTSKGTCIWNI